MAYIDEAYYTETFHGTSLPEGLFERLADIASDVIDAVVHKPVPLTDGKAPDDVKKATAYEVECLYAQGGIDAIVGFATGITAQTETLGNYSVGRGTMAVQGSSVSIPSIEGLPVSRMTIAMLSQAGLMSRWAYDRR